MWPREVPAIDIVWRRGGEKITWDKPKIHLALGKKDSGKSALLEAIAMRYPKIVDIYSSRDNESLCWLRSPLDDILLIMADNCDLKTSWETVKTSDLTYNLMDKHECSIVVPGFFQDNDALYKCLEKVISEFYKRQSWQYPTCMIIREASNFIYSRIKAGQNTLQAKSDFIYFQREMRHFGYAICVDTIRWTSMDKEVRDLADFLYIKKLGHQGLPDDIGFLYRYANPMKLARLTAAYFVLLTESASIGFGKADYPKFHKDAGEDLMIKFDLKPEFGEPIIDSSDQKVGDEEHSEIIDFYIDKNISMFQIASIKNRSTRTIKIAIDKHNTDVSKNGLCEICERVGSPNARALAKRYRTSKSE